MRYGPAIAMIGLLAAPARADGDELRPVPARVLIGKAYRGAGEASEIEFINVRRGPVRIEWIGFDGAAHVYATIEPGGELVQPTYVSHRWIVRRADGDAPIAAYISTRSDLHGDGQPQLAIIR